MPKVILWKQQRRESWQNPTKYQPRVAPKQKPHTSTETATEAEADTTGAEAEELARGDAESVDTKFQIR